MKLFNRNVKFLSIAWQSKIYYLHLKSLDEKALSFINKNSLDGEVLIVDNGSTDSSPEIAASLGATVIYEPHQGYGRALRTGLREARGEVVIFGDCDSTYDFKNLEPIYEPLASGEYDFITGDRFSGLMEEGAMSLSHHLGVPFLSWCGRRKFHVKIHDWHCGLRGIRRDALERMMLRCDGMEFATEMIAEAAKHQLRISEVPVVLRMAKEERHEKLRTIRDGFRHLWYILKTPR